MISPQLFDEYDIIIAGGGTAGGVILGRLAAADPSLRILMLEAGPPTKDDLAHIQPARFLTHILPSSDTVKHVVGKPSDYLNGRQLTIQCGQCVGGGSSVGCMVYAQPPASDYDDWAHVHNNPGWSFKDLLPLIKKAETYQVAPGKALHGHDGPLKVSCGGALTNIGEDYMVTVSQYDKSRPILEDSDVCNTSLIDLNRVHHWPKWIDGETGRRSDVAHSYIYPALDGSRNVHLLPGCTVQKVIIEDGRATGVEYNLNSTVMAGVDTTPRIVRATKLVVLSAGTFGSPAILERSGIGSKDVLDRNGIAQLVDLPGVGENYSDHPLILMPFLGKQDADTLHGIVHGDPTEHQKWSAKWHEDGQGLMGSNGLDGMLRYRPSKEEVQGIGPEFAERWDSFFASVPDKPVMLVAPFAGYSGTSPPPAHYKVYSIGASYSYPEGIGSVHISAFDEESPVDFDTGVLKRKEDVAIMRHGWKLCREHARRMSSYRGEYAPGQPKFPVGSAAAVSPNHDTPIPIDAPNIVYTKADDEAIDSFLKANVVTAWNSLGTCAMKPRDKGGVVDSRLNVYGVQNLKVADMSICPSIIAANGCATGALVGEKAAVIVGEEMGITSV